MPANATYLDVNGLIAFAHRGGDRVAPENTVAAFEHAVSLGYNYLETDVHRSADGVLVAFHDSNLTRTCGVDADIGDLTWNEIAELRVDGKEPIPQMTELLERWPDHRFNIDCKTDAGIEPLVQLVRRRNLIPQVCIGSFNLFRQRRLRRRLGPNLTTALAPSEIMLLLSTGRLSGSAPRAAQVPINAGKLEIVTERFIASAHRCNIAVHVWTINDAPTMHRLIDLGVDGIMTDDVDLLRDVLIERGRWTGPQKECD